MDVGADDWKMLRMPTGRPRVWTPLHVDFREEGESISPKVMSTLSFYTPLDRYDLTARTVTEANMVVQPSDLPKSCVWSRPLTKLQRLDGEFCRILVVNDDGTRAMRAGEEAGTNVVRMPRPLYAVAVAIYASSLLPRASVIHTDRSFHTHPPLPSPGVSLLS